MRPTAPELISYLDEAYSERIMPVLDDPFVRNRANILSQIIGALFQRWQYEGQMLWLDNAELRTLLTTLRPHVPDVDVDGALDRAAAITPDAATYPAVDVLLEVNNVLKGALEAAVSALPVETGGDVADVEQALHDYLKRQLERELQICSAPVFGEGEGVGRRADLPRA